MKIGIYCNKAAKKFAAVQNELVKCLKKKDIAPILFEETEQIHSVDVLIVPGGDGTILKAAIEAGKQDILVIGINAGTLGFLSEFESEQIDEAVDLLCGSFETERRSVLQIEVGEHVFYALNDAVFQRTYERGGDNNVVEVTVSIDGKKVDRLVGDGVIVCTPTGSTAYSLSAGGSILTPDIAAFALTPICPHSLHNRPIVYADSSLLEIERGHDGPKLSLLCDGRRECVLDGTVKAKISKAPFDVKFIKKKDSNFFDKLLFKLNKWSM